MRHLACLLPILVAGCARDAVIQTPVAPSSTPGHLEPGLPPAEAAPVQVPAQVAVHPEGEVALLPLSPVAEPLQRPRRRMNIDQLDAAIRRVTGGIGWTEKQGQAEVNLFQQLGKTLGRPDFVEITQEDLTASTLFMKFLGDAARSVCGKLAAADGGASPVFFASSSPTDTWKSAPEKIKDNLRALLLRFHGRRLTATVTDDAHLEPWRWLYASVEHTAQSPLAGWTAVCVALVTHPDFTTY